jgi:AcrR family transcriptional regulator
MSANPARRRGAAASAGAVATEPAAPKRGPGRPRAGPETAASVKQRVIEATYRLIAASGDLEPSMRDILRESELSTHAFYRFFASKDELMLVLLEDGRTQMSTYLRHRMQRQQAADEQLREWIRGIVRQAEDPSASKRTRPFLINRAKLEVGYPEQIEQTETVLIGLLAEAIDRGNADGTWSSADPAGDARVIHDFTMAEMRRSLIRRRTPPPGTVDRLTGFALRALGGPRPTSIT